MLKKFEIGVVNKDARALLYDFQIIAGIANGEGETQEAADALYIANKICNTVHPQDPQYVQ